MIGRLHGVLLAKQAPALMVDVGGVGYELEAPMSTFYDLPELGQRVTLHTHLVVREDAQLLYGFYREADRALFRTLIKVNGVGPKLALTILSGMAADALVQCVADNDIPALVRLPGIGKKTAERLLIELRDRIGDMGGGAAAAGLPAADLARAKAVVASHPANDAISALVALGYKPQEASRMVKAVESDGMASEEIIRQALKAAATR